MSPSLVVYQDYLGLFVAFFFFPQQIREFPMALSLDDLQRSLALVLDPKTKRPITELEKIRDLHIEGTHVKLTVKIGSPNSRHKSNLEKDIRQVLKNIGVSEVEIVWEIIMSSRSIGEDDPIPQVANVIFVMSGKGGVGKSTVATNLTLALSRAGFRVGLLDADIYGPSIPTMLGVAGRPISIDGKHIEPLERFGIKLMSIGFLLEDPKSAVIWRGPMLHGALLQFFRDVNWGKLHFLLIDLPPGTGDVALTLSQRVRSTGAVIVTTPQEVALQDVYKSVAMCQKVEIPILGVVENMSYFDDPAGNRHQLFGSGGGEKIAEFAQAPLLGQLPLDPKTREWGDAGTPVVQAAPDLEISKAFAQIADRLVEEVSDINAGDLEIDRSGGKGTRHLPVVR
jgi:ATP-binding protein involved in chromosome partitioning